MFCRRVKKQNFFSQVAICGSDIALYSWNEVAKTIATLPFIPGRDACTRLCTKLSVYLRVLHTISSAMRTFRVVSIWLFKQVRFDLFAQEYEILIFSVCTRRVGNGNFFHHQIFSISHTPVERGDNGFNCSLDRLRSRGRGDRRQMRVGCRVRGLEGRGPGCRGEPLLLRRMLHLQSENSVEGRN